MSIVGDLTTYLRASTAITNIVGTRIHHNSVPQDASRPYVWMRRSGEEEELTMDGIGELVQTDFDVECYAVSNSGADSLADVVKARLHGISGTVGTATVRGMFVKSKDDDYVPRGDFSNEGLSVVALGVKIWHEST